MNVWRNNILRATIATIFIVLVLFPTGIRVFHDMANHEHLVCHDHNTHLHKKQADCSIVLFHFQPFATPLFTNIISFQAFIKTDFTTFITPSAPSLFLSFFNLRAPPASLDI